MNLAVVEKVLTSYSLLTAFAIVGFVMWVSYLVANRLTRGRVHGSAIAIFVSLRAKPARDLRVKTSHL